MEDLEPTKSLFDVKKQKNLFGSLYNGTNVPIRDDKPTPVFTGCLREYQDHFAGKKQYVILLGPSGTSKTFMLQQEAQKTFMIYILCNDGATNPIERDSSFTSLRLALGSKETTEAERLKLVQLFMIARVLYLRIALEAAKKEGKELSPREFFMLQLNGYSKQTQDLFNKVRMSFEGVNYDFSLILDVLLRNILETYPYVKQKMISFAIDEAGVANHLCQHQFTSPSGKKRALLTAMMSTLSILEQSVGRFYVAGTHMSLADKDTVVSAVGKDKPYDVMYTWPASPDEQWDILNYLYDMKGVKMEVFSPYLHVTKKRLMANTVKFLSFESNKTLSLQKALNSAYCQMKEDLMDRFKKSITNEHEKIRQYYMESLEKLLYYSFFLRDSRTQIELPEGVDLMHLGVVNQMETGKGSKCNLILDPLVIDVCKETLKFESFIMKWILNRFGETLMLYGEKSQVKGNDFELVILANFLSEEFQNKNLSELPFICENLKRMNNKNVDLSWLDKVVFKCKDFGTKEMFGMENDTLVLQKEYTLLKPENTMHPDGILVLSHDGKYYILIITVKMSASKLESQTKKENFFAGDLRLIYVDNYWTLMQIPLEGQQTRHSERLEPRVLPKPSDGKDQEKYEAFFKAFPASKIGGVVRLLFEFDVNNETLNPILVNELLDNVNIPQLIIKITSQNMESFFINSKIRGYFEGVHEHLKRKREEKEEESKKKKKE